MHKYLNTLLDNIQSEGIPAYLIPPCIGGERVVDNEVFLNEEIWITANLHAIEALEKYSSQKYVRRHARAIDTAMKKHNINNSKLRNSISKHLLSHINESAPATLYHESGLVAQGSQKELAEQTGLSATRICDLVNGRKRYLKGWCASEEEAKRGKLRPGRKRKNIFDSDIEENVFEDIGL